MALVLTEEQSMLRDSARAFLADHAPVAQLRALRDSRNPDGFSRPLWSQFTEMGYTGILIPEAHGGLGLGHVEAGQVMEEIGRHLSVSPWLASGITAATALVRGGTTAQQAEYLPRIASGELIATLAVDETRKHLPAQTAVRATLTSDGYVLEGQKTFVLEGEVAGLFIVAARTAGQAGDTTGITLFLLERDAVGLQVEDLVLADTHRAARLNLDQVVVAKGAVLGEVGQGWAVLQAALDAGRIAAAAELLGVAQEAFDRTVGYLKERRQFERIIGEFQALQHRASVLYVEIEMTRAVVLKAQQALDEGSAQASALVSVAKAKAGTTATLAVQEGVQLHGGMGMTDEFDLGFFMKRARVLQEVFGDAAFHADQLAQQKRY